MTDPLSIGSFAGLLFVVVLTLGQAAAYCVAVGMEDDDRSAVWTPVGVTLGELVHLIVGAAGASWLVHLPCGRRLPAVAGRFATCGIVRLRHTLERRVEGHTPFTSSWTDSWCPSPIPRALRP